MNKPYFSRIFFLTDWRHKRLKNTIDLLLFYGENFNGFSESELHYFLLTEYALSRCFCSREILHHYLKSAALVDY